MLIHVLTKVNVYFFKLDDGQTNRQKIRVTNRQTDRQTDRLRDKQTCEVNRRFLKIKHLFFQSWFRSDKQTEKQRDEQTDRQSNRQTDRQTDKLFPQLKIENIGHSASGSF